MGIKYLLPAILWSAVIFLIIAVPGSNIPQSPLFEIPYFDKMVHAGMFFVLSILFHYGFYKQTDNSLFKSYYYIISLIICVIYGGLTELHQNYFVDGRFGDIGDFIANTAGALAGFAFFYYLKSHPFIASRFFVQPNSTK